MVESFDPYYRWLSIPPAEQPPNHYRLLGLRELEQAFDVIEHAAERQIAHVCPFLETPLRPFAANLIGELEVARQCLLNPETKRAYDAWLGQRVSRLVAKSRSHVPPQSPPDIRPIDRGETVASSGVPHIIHAPGLRRRKPKAAPIAMAVLWLAGGAIGLLAGYAVLCMLDPKYDFLHVMFAREMARAEESPLIPTRPQPPKTVQPAKVPSRPRILASSPRKLQPLVAAPDSAGASASPQTDERMAVVDSPRPREFPPARSPIRWDVPAAVPLPSLRTESGGPTLLCVLTADEERAEEMQRLVLSVVQGSNRDAGSLQVADFDRGSDRSSDHGVGWDVRWSPPTADGDDSTAIVIGRFSLIGTGLSYAWSPDVPRPAFAALRNSLLQLSLDSVEHYSALRIAERVSPLSIDVNQQRGLWSFDCDEMPEAENVRVDIDGNGRFPKFAATGSGLKGLKLNDETTLWYQEAKGVSTSIRFSKRGRRLLLGVQSRYELPSGYSDALTMAGGNLVLQSLQRDLFATQALAAKARTTAKSTAARERIKVIETDLAALAPISDLAAKLSSTAPIPVRYYLDVDGQQIDLGRSAE